MDSLPNICFSMFLKCLISVNDSRSNTASPKNVAQHNAKLYGTETRGSPYEKKYTSDTVVFAPPSTGQQWLFRASGCFAPTRPKQALHGRGQRCDCRHRLAACSHHGTGTRCVWGCSCNTGQYGCDTVSMVCASNHGQATQGSENGLTMRDQDGFLMGRRT